MDLSGVPDDFPAAFAQLYPRARTVAYRILGDRADAEDAAAEAMTRALMSWRRVGRLEHREAWILRVAANVAVDMCRRRRPLSMRSDPISDPAEAATLRLGLATALASLPRRQRQVIVLQHLVGLPQPEVAQAMGLSLGSVKRHSHRGLAGMRKRLGPGWEGAAGVAP